ncbi:MAG: GAF domain-containing protein [Alkalibacterium sp.]|nr:GAF domain-containing protein [Alkalibacterium sp.]
MQSDKLTLLNKQLKAIITDESNFIANLSNASALLFEQLDDINWAGFYLFDNDHNNLVLGPFQGKVACIRIENGKGVCGTSFKSGDSLIVSDVHEFPGHIACDAASRSEIVVPLIKGDVKIGVLDIDAPVRDRFSESDRLVLEEFCSILLNSSDTSSYQ